MLSRTLLPMLFVLAPLSLAVALDQPTGLTALTHVRVIDGTGHPPLEDATVVIEGNHILAVEQGAASIPANAKILDLHGDTVMPGLINAHGHLALIADGKNSATAYTPENVLTELRQYESYGVTSMLSLGLNRDLLYPIREQQREGKLDGATVFTADRGIGVPDAAPGLPAAPDQLYRPATAEEARSVVDAMAKRHADVVKIWVDSVGGTKPTMSPEVYRAVIKQAHKHHLRVAAHIYYLADAKSLVNDGVDILAHSVRDKPVDQELIAAMKRRGVWYIPTFTVDESFYIYAQHPGFMQLDFFKDAVSPVVLTMLSSDTYSQKVNQDPSTAQHKADFAMDQQNLKTLYDAGVRVGFGTDSGAMPTRIPGFSEHRELEDMVQAGLTPMQAIVCATRNNAELLGIEATRGTLRPGKRADLLVLAANPLDDITNTRSIVTIFHDGRTVAPRVPVVTAR
ncbi:MAG TPA: amidohydrolase family protein [Acidobacteriaceae bacterium]|jgi:imidazolonepropionase-like amidohydrolase|nr:amidohydrolase family protein [Acidobacteriaceae bacterium]